MRVWTVGLCALLAGCASGSIEHTPASLKAVITERTINLPFEKVWDSYVAELSRSFFIINNIEKDSRIINVSFSTNNPSEFVDCGSTVVKSSHPSTGEQVFSYNSADDSNYNFGVEGTNALMFVQRDTNLEGRVNIYIAPRSAGSTDLRVNARYAFGVLSKVSSNRAGETAVKEENYTFSSAEHVEIEQETGWRCAATGSLESRLLNLI